MFYQIKKQIDKNLFDFVNQADKSYSLSSISPVLFSKIKNFLIRPGKRIRPVLFVIGYKGYAKKSPAGLYRSALSVELLHDFMLIHDDIIDKSSTRRGKPSMHAMFNNYLSKEKKIKFSGNDLAIVAGDIVYALAIDAFLSVKVNFRLKEKALRNFLKAAALTGSGEFIELLGGLKKLNSLKKSDIYKIYQYKTAFYTFSCPLSTGAILAGAGKKELKGLETYGKCIGEAFQIKDDILGMFGCEKNTGKSSLSDLQEAKKTLLIFYAYQNSCQKNKKNITRLLEKKKINYQDLSKMRELIIKSKALALAQKDIKMLLKKSRSILSSLEMKKPLKEALTDYFLPLFKEKIQNKINLGK